MRTFCQPVLAKVAAAVVAVAALIVLFVFPPENYSFYPQCQFHRLTGLNCPGCGSLRALHELTHAHLGAAFHLNPMLVLGLPVAAVLAVRWIWRRRTGNPRPTQPIRPVWLWIAFGFMAAFGVLRNLPFPPFDRLGP